MTRILQKQFPYRYYQATMWLIGINVIVFILFQFSPRVIPTLFMMNTRNIVEGGMYWQFITHMFSHFEGFHLLFNMLGLYFFGTALERRLGSDEFLLFYMFSGIMAGFFSFLIYYFLGSDTVFLLGASGAVYGLLLGFATYYPEQRLIVMFFPMKASTAVLVFTGISLLSLLSNSNQGVGHLTHLAGFAFAFLYLLVRLRINPIDSFKRNRYTY
jgi:membrane associated rhomboid family serine protease